MSVVTRIVRLCDVCIHAGTETVDAQPLVITVNRGPEQSIDLCTACSENFVMPFLSLFQELGRQPTAKQKLPKSKRGASKRTSTTVLDVLDPAPVSAPEPVLEAAPEAPSVEAVFVCKVEGCVFETRFLKGYIAHATKKHGQDWDAIAQAVGTRGGDHLCPVCGVGFPTKDRARTHARARHPEQAR